MTYRFSLRDEEDELSAPILDEPGYSLADESMDTAPPVIPPARAQQRDLWQPTVSQRDPALQEQWSLAEKNSLERSQYNPRDYGLAEGLRDNAGMAIAGVLDVALNKGRGLGNIATEASKINNQYETQRREDARDAGSFALRARQMKSTDLADQLAVKRLQNQDRTIEQQDQRIDLALQGEGRRGSEFNRKYDPNNPAILATKEALKGAGVNPELIENLDQKGLEDLRHRLNLDMDHANAPRKLGDDARSAAVTSAATTDARNRVDTSWAPSLGAARGEGNRRAEEIERPGKVRTAGETTRATTTAGNEANAPKDLVKATAEFNDKNKGLLKMRDELNAVLEGVPEGGAYAGSGRGERLKSAVGLGSLNSEAAQDNEGRLADIIIKMSAEDFGANSTARQEVANTKRILGDPLATPEQRTKAIRRTLEAVETDIAGAASANPEAAKRVTSARGAGAPAASGGRRTVTLFDTQTGQSQTKEMSESAIRRALADGWEER